MSEGTMKAFIEARGFGFIRNDEGGPDLFVHIKDCRDSLGNPLDVLRKGDRVSFTGDDAPKGPRAINVQLIEDQSYDTAF